MSVDISNVSETYCVTGIMLYNNSIHFDHSSQEMIGDRLISKSILSTSFINSILSYTVEVFPLVANQILDPTNLGSMGILFKIKLNTFLQIGW